MLYVIVEKRYTAETLGGQGSGIVVAASSTCKVLMNALGLDFCSDITYTMDASTL